MCALGSMYRDGLGVKQSNRTAFWYFGMAADLGDVRAKAITNEMQAAKQKRQEQLRNSRIQIATRSIYEER
jgi:TPR repeat protein